MASTSTFPVRVRRVLIAHYRTLTQGQCQDPICRHRQSIHRLSLTLHGLIYIASLSPLYPIINLRRRRSVPRLCQSTVLKVYL